MVFEASIASMMAWRPKMVLSDSIFKSIQKCIIIAIFSHITQLIGMKKIAILFLTTLFAYGQQKKTSLSIESIFNESAMVFSGQVADKQSYWNVGRKMIYTVHTVKVSKSFKGDQDQIVYVVTEGGAVGLQGVAVKPSVKIERESSGFFMVKNANAIELDGFVESDKLMVFSSGIKGFFNYDAYEKSVRIQGESKESLAVFEKDLEKLSKKKAENIDVSLAYSIFSNAALSSSTIFINSLSPQSIVAGNKEVLTIVGGGFGELSSNTGQGKVSFENADDGGNTWIDCLQTHIVSWSDSEIKVEVPADSGSGKIRIQTSDGKVFESYEEIDIPYSIQTYVYTNDGPDERREYPIYHRGSSYQSNDNISNGMYNFTLNTDFFSTTSARESFEYHLAEWVCSTGLNFNILSDTTQLDVAESDNVNVVSFGQTDALGVTYSYYRICEYTNANGELVGADVSWDEIDIIFNENISWGYENVQPNEYDFNSVSKHEIGHALGFGHNINTSTLMHYATGTGPGVSSIDPYLSGAEFILERNISKSVCNQFDPHVTADCSTVDPNLDLDGDGIKDFFDDCPNTPTGSSVDNNGCAASQIDSDQDGVTDDIDNCPGTPETSVVNSEGCADTDLDLVTDNIDLCPNTILGNDVDEFGCSLDQKDTDNDGVTDDFDQCNETPEGSFVDAYGCTVFSLPRDNYQVVVQSNSCVNSNDGLIYISAKHQDYDYTIAVNDSSYDLNQTTGFELSIDNLSVGTYEICISVVGESDYQQCYSVLVSSPEPLEVFAAQTLSGERVDFQVKGSERYFVSLNGKVKMINSNTTHVLLDKGLNHVRIYTDNDCQGIYDDYFFNSHEIILFPSKTRDNLTLFVDGQDRKMDVYVYDLKGKLVFQKLLELGESRRSTLNFSQLSDGIYFLEAKGNTVHNTLKFIKDE